ncbi:MAG: MFS transporter [Candidatus Thermoplasmatota archaeon]|nr:MFS transporter [Candidatus Thermoplasmatota archaeon]
MNYYPYRRILFARFSGLIGPVPLDVEATFRLASNLATVQLLGFVMTAAILLEIGIQPYISVLLDSHSRKEIQFLNLMIFSSAMMVCGILTSLLGTGKYWYSVAFIAVDLYYFVSYQAYAALAQELVPGKIAGSYNGFAEIVGQSPVFVGGILSAVLWNFVGFGGIMLLCAAVTILGTLPLKSLPARNVGTGLSKKRPRKPGHYMSGKFRSILYIFLLNAPYVAVVSGNYLKPIFIAQVLSGSPGTLGLSESVYAGMAALTGILAPVMIQRVGEFSSAMIFSAIYAAASLLMPLLPFIWIFFMLQALHGTGNPGNRISRNTIVMKNVPKEEIGRFNGSVNLLTMLSRVLILAAYIITLNTAGVRVLMEVTAIGVCLAMLVAGIIKRGDPLGEFFASRNAAGSDQ